MKNDTTYCISNRLHDKELDAELADNENAPLLQVEEALEGVKVVPFEAVKLSEEIGKGGFGSVYKYALNSTVSNTTH
jgi:hypothetical protein